MGILTKTLKVASWLLVGRVDKKRKEQVLNYALKVMEVAIEAGARGAAEGVKNGE